MSWSISAGGKAPDAAAMIALQADRLEQNNLPKPEDEVVKKVADIIAFTLAALPEDTEVKVAAWGSQSWTGALGADDMKVVGMSLHIDIS